MKVPRPYQTHCIDMLRRSIGSGKRRPVVKVPTGGGKTKIASMIISMAEAKNPNARVLFVVDAISLIDQTVEAFASEGIYDIGVIQADHEMTDWLRRVQVASVQTLCRRPMPKADIVFVDECHRQSKWLHGIMAKDEWKDIPFIGLSATPWAKGMAKVYDDLIIPVTMQELIDQGYLSKFRVFAPSHPDLTGVKVERGDYQTDQLSKVMADGNLVADLVTTWKKLAENRPTLIFCVDRAHAAKVQGEFNSAGVPCGYIDAFTDSAERRNIRAQLEAGHLKAVANVGCLTTGVDWAIGCIVLARPTRSEMLYVQMVGRGLRVNPNIPDCIILDHADNALRMGFVTDIHHDTLDDGSRSVSRPKPREALPKECPSCSFLRPPKVRECPACGFVPERRSGVEEVSGELVEITDSPKKKRCDWGWPDRIRFVQELRGYAREAGKAEGWVAHKYRDATGVWPNDPRVKYADPIPCSEGTRSWIKSQNIRYAKRKVSAR